MSDDTHTGDEDLRTVLVLSGPNLDLLGARQPEVYGTETLEDHLEVAREAAAPLGIEIIHQQSNHEGELVEAIHRGRLDASGVIINPGAFTHYSWALHDALAAFDGPVIELHLSNPGAREEFRRHSVITPVSTAVIAGLGGSGYALAVRAMAELIGSLRR